MKITGIEKAKGERYTVYVDDEYWYILDIELIVRNSLRVGLAVEQELLDDLRAQAERRRARERGYYLLGYRDHSGKELYDKLCRSVSPEAAAETVALLQQQGYIDDAAYAAKLARHCLITKKWGERRALLEMSRRGIDRETAALAIEECEVDPVEQIKAVIEKKYAARLEDKTDRRETQKVIAALARLGFGFDDIRQALDEYGNEEEWDEE